MAKKHKNYDYRKHITRNVDRYTLEYIAKSRRKIQRKLKLKFHAPKTIGFIKPPSLPFKNDRPENFVNDKRNYYRNEYLKSEHWIKLRAAKLSKNPTCEHCGAKRNVEPHHVDYKNLYDVILDDLITLCRRCHVLEHERINKEKK